MFVNATTSHPKRAVMIQRFAAILVLLLVWQAVVLFGLAPSMTPGVIDVFEAIGATLLSGNLWAALLQTILAALSGWVIAAVVGILLGLVIGTFAPIERVTSAIIDFGRSFPIIALLPVLLMFLGANLRMEIVVVSLSCLWPVLVQTIYGARRIESALNDTVRVFRIPVLLRFRRVVLPSALPFIATGLRISASIAVLVAVSTEVLSQTPGLGRQITLAQEAQHWSVAFAYLFFTGLLGWGLSALLSMLERRFLAWNVRAAA